MKNIVILEDDASFRELIISEFKKADGIQCVASYNRIKDLINDLNDLDPDFFWLDISLPDGKSTDFIAQIKEMHPNALVMLCTMHDDDENIFEALKQGADGYILKNATLELMTDSVRELFKGGSVMSPFIARKVLHSFRPSEKTVSDLKNLTAREKEILSFLAQGYLYKEVADNCNISLQTVKKHVQNIYKKLHVQNRTEAIIKFLKEK
jgi:NarL family two-component system response regulator LiaR